MRSGIRSTVRYLILTLVCTSAAPGMTMGNDLDCMCRDWQAVCGGECDPSSCPETPTGDYGLEIELFQGAAGCTIPAAKLEITNNNPAISVMVLRYGATPKNNIYFQNACPGPACASGECCPDCECHPTTCPPGGCKVLPSCEVCGCEIEASTTTLLAGDGTDVQLCLTPDSPENPCDATECDDSDFCLFLTPPGGIHFRITRVSFDGGACWLGLGSQGILVDENQVAVTTMPGCPGTEGDDTRRACE